MILIEKTQIMGLEPTIRGMQNPMNSWAKSDSFCEKPCHECPDNQKCAFYFSEMGTDEQRYRGKDYIGPNDLDLMLRLAKAGSVDGKFRRMIAVYVDLTAPLYWWKEFDTYKVGTVANSCSTMHKIHAKEFTLDDFSHEHLTRIPEQSIPFASNELYIYDHLEVLQHTIDAINTARAHYLETKDKMWWWQMIQLLPSSYNQKRTVMLNYEVLSNIYQHWRYHKLDEWRELCHWIEGLPYSEIITCNSNKSEFTYKELYEKFLATHSFVEVSDYRPYPLCENSIIVWVSKLSNMPLTVHKEIAFHYDPQKDIFAPILDAKSYDEILNGAKED